MLGLARHTAVQAQKHGGAGQKRRALEGLSVGAAQRKELMEWNENEGGGGGGGGGGIAFYKTIWQL